MTDNTVNTPDELQLAKAEAKARELHAGQQDKGGNDYILHPQQVAGLLTNTTDKTIAWLHDSIEDTDYTPEQMEADGFDDEVITAVQLLTHGKNQSYKDYMQALSSNEHALHVKLADLISNLDVTRIPIKKRTDKDEIRRINKYLRAFKYAVKVLDGDVDALSTYDDIPESLEAEKVADKIIMAIGKAGLDKNAIDVVGTNIDNIALILKYKNDNALYRKKFAEAEKIKKMTVRNGSHRKHPKKPPVFSGMNAKVVGVVLLLLAIIMAALMWSPKNPADIPSNEGFALLKNNAGIVDTVTVNDIPQTVVIKLKKDYTRKSDKKKVGKEVQFGWSIGQRDQLGKILDKSNYAHGYTVIGSRSNFWGNLIASLLPTLLIIGILVWMMKSSDLMGGFGSAGIGGNSKDVEALSYKPEVTFDDVAGEDTALIELREIKDMLAAPEKYKKIGAKLPKGVMLYGPPGTGKTLLAKALAGEVGVPFYAVSSSSLIEVYAGLGARRVRNLFDAAKKSKRAIIYLDEIDAIAGARGRGNEGNGEREQTLNQLLTCMDGFESNGDIIVVASTNRPDMLDKALMRPGRFDRQIGVDLPDLKGREDILHVHASGKKFADNVDSNLHWVAQNTSGFSGAQLANVINEAALMAVRENRDEISLDDLSEAIDRTLMGPKKTTREDYKKSLRLTAYHEAGHALAAMATPGADPVNKITILPRSNALGYTAINSDDDRTNYTRTQLLGQLNYMLGGWAAEELVFKDVSTGPSNDIEKATSLARNIITKYGFSDKLGIGVWSYDRSNPDEMPVSDETLRETDLEVRSLIETAHDNAVKALETNRKVLDELADKLLEKETVTPDDLKSIRKEVIMLSQ